MKRRILFPCLIAALGAAFSFAAHAQSVCGPREAVTGALERQYAERPFARGLGDNGNLIEVWAAPDGGFTILMTAPNGVACLMAAGKDWHGLAAVPKAKGTAL